MHCEEESNYLILTLKRRETEGVSSPSVIALDSFNFVATRREVGHLSL